MIAATIMSVTFTPVFYVVMKRLGKGSTESTAATTTPATEQAIDQR
jgi:hypothetical protein